MDRRVLGYIDPSSNNNNKQRTSDRITHYLHDIVFMYTISCISHFSGICWKQYELRRVWNACPATGEVIQIQSAGVTRHRPLENPSSRALSKSLSHHHRIYNVHLLCTVLPGLISRRSTAKYLFKNRQLSGYKFHKEKDI